MDPKTHYVQRPSVALTPCGMSRQAVAELGDLETRRIVGVTCTNCALVLWAVFEDWGHDRSGDIDRSAV